MGHPCCGPEFDTLILCLLANTERTAPERTDYRRLPINSTNIGLEMLLSPAYCTTRPRCYRALSRSLSLSLCRLLKQHHPHRCVCQSPVKPLQPRDRSLRYGMYLWPPATRQRPSAPVPFSLRWRRLTMRVATLEPTPLEATVRIRGHSQSQSQNESGGHERRDTSTRMAIWAVWAICSAFLVYVMAVE